MKSLYKQWESEIRNYLADNNLKADHGKPCASASGVINGVKRLLVLDATPDENSQLGLADETPAPVVLMVEEVDGGLVFRQTEHTKAYFS